MTTWRHADQNIEGLDGGPSATTVAPVAETRPAPSTYRHEGGSCGVPKPMADQWPPIPGARRRVCGCTTPTPDPASPCGYPTCNQRAIAHVHMGAHGVYGRHPHVPTRCTCGHPLEATR